MIVQLESVSTLLAFQDAAASDSNVTVSSVWDFVTKGGWMMVPIGLCSFIALTVLIERLISLRRSAIIPSKFLPGLKKILSNGEDGYAQAIAFCRQYKSPVANVFAAGIRKLGHAEEVVEKHIDEAGRREVLKMRKNLRVLSVIAAIAPLLGLLGTIFGMITAFSTVASAPEALGKTEMLAEGIYEAMITTAAGLIVAIPTLIFYHWLSARVERLVMEIDHMTVDFIDDYAMGGDAVDELAPAQSTGSTVEEELPGAVSIATT